MTVVKNESRNSNVIHMKIDAGHKEDSLFNIINHIEKRMIEMQIDKIKNELKLNEQKLINNLRKCNFMIMNENNLSMDDLAMKVNYKAEDIEEALNGSGGKNQRIILSEICIYLINLLNRKFE
ncbi:hypothetical protein V7056_00010 [Bacillus sp. JJ664]